jgi:bifunctional enzyme CysN/CysC
LRRTEAATLKLNEIGRCQIALNQAICFDAYRRNRGTGAIIALDRMSNGTVGAGMILDRTTSDRRDYWQDEPTSQHLQASQGQVTADEWSLRLRQLPTTLLLTGLTGSGKTTIAYALERRLFDGGHLAAVIDGQNMRMGLSKDLGFSPQDRSENLRRCVEVARFMNGTGILCICAFVAPSAEIRQRVRQGVGEDRFVMVHLSAPVEVCRQRHTDGMYAAAEAGEIDSFPGVTERYEPPESADIVLPTDRWSVEKCVDAIVELLHQKQRIL